MMESLGAAAIVGLVNGIILLRSNIEGFIYFVIAVATGLGVGLLGMYGQTPETGLLIGLASSGLYKGLQVVGAVKK